MSLVYNDIVDKDFLICIGMQIWMVLNIPRFQICQVSANARVTQGTGYTCI